MGAEHPINHRRIIPRDTITPERIIKHPEPLSPGNPEITLKRSRERPIITAKKKAISPGDIIKVPGKPKSPKKRLKKAWRNLTGRPPRYN